MQHCQEFFGIPYSHKINVIAFVLFDDNNDSLKSTRLP